MAGWSLPDALDLLHQQFPAAYVTSGARDPNSALGKANPRSYHNVGEAFDIRPIPGVNFNTYVQRLKAAGLPVVESLNEAKNPKPWTTGPNWHIAFSGDKQVATNPIDLLRRAQASNIDLPPEAMPPAGGPMSAAPAPAQAPGFDLQSLLQQMASRKLPMEEKRKVPTWAKILGVLGDTYTEVHGNRPGAFIPTLLHNNDAVDERNLAREKLNEQIDSDTAQLAAKLGEQPSFIQNAMAWQQADNPTRRAVLQYQDATNPIINTLPDGPHLQPRTSTKVINGKTYYSINGQWFEEGD